MSLIFALERLINQGTQGPQTMSQNALVPGWNMLSNIGLVMPWYGIQTRVHWWIEYGTHGLPCVTTKTDQWPYFGRGMTHWPTMLFAILLTSEQWTDGRPHTHRAKTGKLTNSQFHEEQRHSADCHEEEVGDQEGSWKSNTQSWLSQIKRTQKLVQTFQYMYLYYIKGNIKPVQIHTVKPRSELFALLLKNDTKWSATNAMKMCMFAANIRTFA
jgi:hypothetical protein